MLVPDGAVGAAVLALFVIGQPLTAKQAGLDPMSLMTTPTLLISGTRQVSQGTGFLYATMKPNGIDVDMVFLVTNYHVVTGNDPLSNARPQGDRLQFYFHASQVDPANYFPVNIPLYTKTNDPIWIQSKQIPEADVVLVPLVVLGFLFGYVDEIRGYYEAYAIGLLIAVPGVMTWLGAGEARVRERAA